MKSKLITSLRLAANTILNGQFDYNWKHHESCNCGVLTCAITNKSPAELEKDVMKLTANMPMDEGHTWSDILSYTCPLTGFSNRAIYNQLKKAGLTREDMHHLEFLSDPRITARMKRRTGTILSLFFWKWSWGFGSTVLPIDYENPIDCANYMLAWADLLVEEGRDDTGTVETAVTTGPALAA